jgi:hypothetical protein
LRPATLRRQGENALLGWRWEEEWPSVRGLPGR